MAEVDLSSLGPSQSFQTSDTENLQQHLPKVPCCKGLLTDSDTFEQAWEF